MEPDDPSPRRADDAIARAAREDLDPLSVDELHARIAALQGEIARCQARIARALGQRASAESLFRR